MRFIKAMPVVAILALAACDDPQTAQTETAPPPTTETPAAPVTGEAQRPDADPQASSPTTADTAAAPVATDQPQTLTTDSAIGVPQTTLAPPPTPSSTFAGADAMPPPEAGAAGAVLADAPFDAGGYSVGDLRLELSADGDFTFTRNDTGETVTGEFRVYGDMMTFSNVGTDVAPGIFPMTCRVEPAPQGFQLMADGPSCSLFDGQTFVRG
jgi:hypothetical protein